jgi:hypothetical protein
MAMPYKVEKDGENYNVVNEETGEVKATHEPPDAEENAKRQVRLLNAIDHDENWEPGNG